jgi:hypothetical protein
MDCPRVGYDSLKTAAISELEKQGYRCSDEAVFASQVDKVIQMYETQLVRHTVSAFQQKQSYCYNDRYLFRR